MTPPRHPIASIADLKLEPRPESWKPPAGARRVFDLSRCDSAHDDWDGEQP